MVRGQTWSLSEGEDFHFDDAGRLAVDDTVATPLKTALMQHVNAWWAHPAHGSRLAALMAGEPEPDLAAALEDAVRDALAPLVQGRRIRELQVQVTVEGSRARIVASAHDISQDRTISTEVSLP